MAGVEEGGGGKLHSDCNVEWRIKVKKKRKGEEAKVHIGLYGNLLFYYSRNFLERLNLIPMNYPAPFNVDEGKVLTGRHEARRQFQENVGKCLEYCHR